MCRKESRMGSKRLILFVLPCNGENPLRKSFPEACRHINKQEICLKAGFKPASVNKTFTKQTFKPAWLKKPITKATFRLDPPNKTFSEATCGWHNSKKLFQRLPASLATASEKVFRHIPGLYSLINSVGKTLPRLLPGLNQIGKSFSVNENGKRSETDEIMRTVSLPQSSIRMGLPPRLSISNKTWQQAPHGAICERISPPDVAIIANVDIGTPG